MATFTKRESGYWQAKIRRKGYPVQSETFRTKAEAERWAKAIESEMDGGVFVDRREADKNTFRQILNRYLEEVVPEHKGKDVEEIRIKALLKDEIADYKMSALSASALSDYVSRRCKQVSPATVRRELDIISQVITKARRAWGINLVENPVSLIERPRPARARERRLRGDEEGRILAVLEAEDGRRNPFIGPFFRFALETAMRQSEEVGLLWEHVDLDTRTAHLFDTKNGSDRIVPLSKRAVAILRGLLPDSDSETLPNGPVFLLTADALKKAWQRCLRTARKNYEKECAEAGTVPDPMLLKNLRWHDLRHEATSRIAPKLDHVLELSAVTGHKDLRMLKRYYHPNASDIASKLD